MKTTLLIVVIGLTGCSFNPGSAGLDQGAGGNGGGDMTGGGGAGDLGEGPDLSPVCAAGDAMCTGSTLSTCNADGTGFDTRTCVIGCNPAGVDCLALQPTAPAVASDFVYAGLTEPTIAAAQTLLVFNADNGEIRDGAGTVVRMPNAAPTTRNVENGIGFHVTSNVGIWTFSKLTVPATTTIVFKHNATSAGVSILSASDLTIAGTIDARGYMDATMAPATLCVGTVAGPGGTIGGSGPTERPAAGGGGSTADAQAGGGGGGYGDVGGVGGKHGRARSVVPLARWSGTVCDQPARRRLRRRLERHRRHHQR